LIVADAGPGSFRRVVDVEIGAELNYPSDTDAGMQDWAAEHPRRFTADRGKE
jgi:hypothetical protein